MKEKQINRLLILIEVIGLIMWVLEVLSTGPMFDARIERQAPQEGVVEQELLLESPQGKEEITVAVHPKARSKQEIAACMKAAEEEVQSTYLGENTGADHVDQSLRLDTTYAAESVSASWSSTPAIYLESDGRLRGEALITATPVVLTVTLQCEEERRTMELPVTLYPPATDTPEGFHYELQRQLKAADEGSLNSDEMELPTHIGEAEITWKQKREYTGLQICLLGLLAAVGIRVAKWQDAKDKEQKRQKALQWDYPNIVNWLSLYVGAGISMKQAFAMIGKEATPEHPGYEAVLRCSRSMTDGKSELAAYEDLSTYAPEKSYRKLSLLITHHLRKGSEDLIYQLEKEAEAAFEQRKMQAKVAGEEASTKLLIPMLGLLGIILVVLIIPALQGIQI
ncbi:MAG: type II secretion system F family protein [Lachnospiraceae bacterium]|nr:type II secretion system F family protein [Lachnospiraceae bacterium]